jgi:parvulin-like peptidyl-prolyl isomerase
MKKILPLLFTTILGIEAQVIDAIAIDVDGEPITTLDIKAVQSKFNLSKRASIELLIKDRLEKSAIEKAHIVVSDEEIETKIDQMASMRGLSRKKMREVLATRGLSWGKYKRQLEIEIKKEKFFAQNIVSTISRPTDEELRLYYETHKEKFTPSTPVMQISLIVYGSNSFTKLQEAMQNPMKIVQGVQRKNVLISSNEINPKLFEIIRATPEGSFTQPINTGRGFVTYFVKSKSSQNGGGFEMVKQNVVMAWLREERERATRNFISKLKNNANIRIIGTRL